MAGTIARSSQGLITMTAAMTLLAGASASMGQGRVMTLQSGFAWAVSNDGSKSFTSGNRFDLGAASLTMTAMPGTSPSVNCCSDDGLFAGGTVGSTAAAARWSRATNTWTNCPIVAPITTIANVRDISATGSFLVGQCSFTGSGGFAGYITDFTGGTPVTTRLLGNTTTARAMAVSSDGTVVVGAESPNVSSSGRIGVWRKTAGTYVWSYLLDGPVDATGTAAPTRTADNFHINDDGTVIVGTSFVFNNDTGFVDLWLAKWTWNTGTSTWDRTLLYDRDTGPTSLASWWTPPGGCPIPPNLIVTGINEDASIILGKADYSTCGSFYGAGFIFKDSVMYDQYDWFAAQGVDLAGAGYGPYTVTGPGGGTFCHLGYAFDVSDDGQHFVGTPSIDPDAAGPWQVDLGTGFGCVAPVITTNPTAATTFSACTGTTILNMAAIGSPPFSFQWAKNGSAIFTGSTGNGDSTYGVFSGGKQLRVVGPLMPADAGNYACTATNACGNATTTNAVFTVDGTLTAINNDTCAGADLNVVTMGTNVLGASGTSACAAWDFDNSNSYSCIVSGKPRNDRWYKFVPPTTSNYRFDTCGANFDTLITLFDSCGGGELACNNDYVTGPSTGCTSTRSRVSSQPLTAGTPVYIRIAAPSLTSSLSSTSVMNLSITAAPTIPANDSCTTADPIFPGVTAYNTTEALAEPFISTTPLGCASSAHLSRDLWWVYTADTSGLLTATTCPTGTAPSGYSLMSNTVLAFYDSPCGTVVACNDNLSPVPAGCGTSLSTVSNYPVLAGQQVWIRVSGNNSSAFGAGQITLSVACPCVADFDGSGGTPDAGDIDAFFQAWLLGAAAADADCSGGTPDAGDIDGFFSEWLAGGC